MRWNSFGRSLLFGAVAAAGFAPFALGVAPLAGLHFALAAYALVIVPGYLVGVGDSLRRGVGAAGVAGVVGAAGALLAPGAGGALIAVALGLALARSGVAAPIPFARALVVEAGLGAAALVVAEQLVGGSLASIVLAIWGFFLVHSAYFALPRSGARAARACRDPFDDARDRARAILDAALG